MKTQIIITMIMNILSMVFINKVAAHIAKPLCVDVGTQYEGWLMPGEKRIFLTDKCSNKYMECAGINSEFEGWYVFEKQNIKLLERAPCSYNDIQPECLFIGTQYEGWVVPARGMRIYYEPCAGKVVECSGQVFTTEGWYVFNKKPLGVYMYATCSKTLTE
jgi:hypothetical protein